ncbi:MAG: hypothetical protein ACI9W1_000770, partial [Candidatus Azotimanducaceae bacterium]
SITNASLSSNAIVWGSRILPPRITVLAIYDPTPLEKESLQR